MRNQIERNTQLIRQKCLQLGFDQVGISKAEYLDKEAPRLEQWLKEGRQGKMDYMKNHFDLRLDPTQLVPGAKSVISLSLNYFPAKKQRSDSLKIAKYAYGQDYHKVIKKKLKALISYIRDEIGAVEGRGLVDSAPVMDKAWDEKGGLGWVGKNNNLISQKKGSFFLLAELIIDLPLSYDFKVTDHCGSCTKCIEACPTEAIYEPYKVDASRCISYLTIELKDHLLPTKFQHKMNDWIFGCDICQDVCPWNRFSKAHSTPEFDPQNNEWLSFSKKDWEEITAETFDHQFGKSALKRTKFEGLKRNISFSLYETKKEEKTSF